MTQRQTMGLLGKRKIIQKTDYSSIVTTKQQKQNSFFIIIQSEYIKLCIFFKQNLHKAKNK